MCLELVTFLIPPPEAIIHTQRVWEALPPSTLQALAGRARKQQSNVDFEDVRVPLRTV
jgi:hypothetical protein